MGTSETILTVTTSAAPGHRNRPRRRPVRPEAVLLLRMAQTGDRDAFAQLYQAYADNVRRYVTARMRDRDRHAVADLVQDTFTIALDELDRAHDDVEGWLIQLAAKACTRHSWTRRRYLRAALTIGEHEQRLRAAFVPADGSRHTALIASALAELPAEERLTVQLRFLDGQRRTVTAEIMACSEWTVSARQRRALQHLADRLSLPADISTD
jgi:RNA polymerase sigma-70 factor (ECF subfamily)